MSNPNLDSILEELSNMKFSDGDDRERRRIPSRKTSADYQKKQSRLTTNFNNLLDELQETQEYLEKDSSNNSFDKEPMSPRSDRIGRRKYSNSSSSSNKAYSRSRSRSRSEVDRWKDNSGPSSPIEKKKYPSRISSANISNKMKHQSSKSSKSLKVPEKPINPNYEFDDDNTGSLPSSYREDYEYMMNNYDNPSPKSKPYNGDNVSPYLRSQKISSKPSSKYSSPVTSPDLYSRDLSPYDRKSKKKSTKSSSRYSDEESEEEYNYKSPSRSRKSRYNDDDDEYLYDEEDRHSRKTSPVHSRSNRVYKEEDFDEDESDITLSESESSESFISSDDSFEHSSRSGTEDDDDIPLKAAKSKSSGIRGRNRHLKKFNKLESSSYKEEKSPVRPSRSVKKSTSVKKEKKKRALSTSRHNAPLSSNSIKSPKDNIYEETAKENFLARTKKEFIPDYAEASLKKITTRIYIGDATNFENVILTSAMTAREVIKDLMRKKGIPDTPEWTLFELCNDFGVERPLKEWEIVTDIITSWDIQKTKNAIIMKKYNYYESLRASSAVGRFPSIRGKLYTETKPGKYNKRQFELRPNGLYYYKKKATQETLFVNLSSYDVYTLLIHMPNAPTEFAFAIKSTDPIHFFEDKKKYIHYLYAEDINSLFDWVMSIRQGKTEKYVLEQHERETTSPVRSPTSLVPKQSLFKGSQTLLEEKQQRIKSMEAQKSRKYQKENNGPLVQIDDMKTKTRHKSSISSRKSSGGASLGIQSSASRRKEKSGPLINLDGVQSSNSRKGGQSASQTPLSSSSRRGPKPLVDISDAKNCHYCGCSEYKYDPWKQNICGNCHHDHRPFNS